MTAQAHLTLFAHLVNRPDDAIDLAQAALLIAEPEYPGLNIPHYLRRLDELGAEAQLRASAMGSARATAVQPVLEFLYEEQGFHGNTEAYYDPRNSYLNEAIDRRTGIPITLAVVLIEVARRAGVEVEGISFPGHFLARARGSDGPIYIDPFEGRILARSDMRDLYARASGARGDPDPRLLEPASKSQILMRILNNLRAIYERPSDGERLRGVLDRMDALARSGANPREPTALEGDRSRPSGGHTLN